MKISDDYKKIEAMFFDAFKDEIKSVLDKNLARAYLESIYIQGTIDGALRGVSLGLKEHS